MKVGLFIPCFVNAVYPEAGIASYKLLKHFGIDVYYPLEQSCCGQPMANAGFEKESLCMAKKFNKLFAEYEQIVVPSASCAVFVKDNYPELLSEAGELSEVSGKIYELCEFIHHFVPIKELPGKFPHKVSIHNSCHGLRKLNLASASELNITHYSKIKDLLSLVNGIEIFEPNPPDNCCGFGGMFSIEEPATSVCMAKNSIQGHIETGAEYITGADSSCFMHMDGVVRREHLPIKFIHVAQILASGL